MSWVFGVVGDYTQEDVLHFKKIHSAPLQTFQSKSIYIITGGNKKTCFYKQQNGKNDGGWIACGVGIQYKEDTFDFLNGDDWDAIANNPETKLKKLNGHFVFIKWKNDLLECFTDQLGIRNLFMAKLDRFTVFSTRIDWIARLDDKFAIDFKLFGSQWILAFKFSLDCSVANIIRLSQSGYARCVSGAITHANKPWLPEFAWDAEKENVSSLLKKLTVFPLSSGHSLSLGLSGGVDSRALLSILLSSRKNNWALHSLREPQSPDKMTAKRISEHFKIPCSFIEDSIPDKEILLKLLYDYAAQAQASSPLSSILGLQFYKSFNDTIVIDGGLGEIARRRNYNTLLIKGKQALLKKEREKIASLLSVKRSPIFNRDTLNLIYAGVYGHIEKTINAMPDCAGFDTGNWLDLLSTRTEFPNSACLGQGIVDNDVVTYMPYAQPSFVRKLFETPVSERNNGRFIRRIIHENPMLEDFSLVKDGTGYPYYLGNVASSSYMKIKRMFGLQFISDIQCRYLAKLSEFVQDTVHSSAVKQCEWYDYPVIAKMVTGFYDGEKGFAGHIDWFLAFELWRQSMNGGKEMP